MTTAVSTPTYAFQATDFVEQYNELGYCILKGVYSASEVADLKRSFDRAYAEGMCHHADWRHQNRVFWVRSSEKVPKYISGCQWQAWVDPTLDAIRTDPRMLAIIEPFIGRDVKQIINQMHWKMPGSGQTWGLHQDCRSRKPDRAFRNLASAYVQTGIAVDRHWRDNGAMKIVPRSHLNGDLDMERIKTSTFDTREAAVAAVGFDPRDCIDVEMDEGDVALWGPYTIHGGGINVTEDNQRRMLINGYVRASDCDRGQPVFDDGKPVPLKIPAMIQYDKLYTKPDPWYPADGEVQTD